MPDISKVTLPSGSVYDIKDAVARAAIADLQGFTKFLGTTTTALTDGSTTNPITINGESVTAVAGDIALYGNKEFIFNGTAWNEFGDLSALGDLAQYDAVNVAISGGNVTLDTATVNSITDVGSMPTFTVSNEILTITGGSVPTKGSDTTVATGVNTITQPSATVTYS